MPVGSVMNLCIDLGEWARLNGITHPDEHSIDGRPRRPKSNNLSSNRLANWKKDDLIRKWLQRIKTTLGEVSEILDILTPRYVAEGNTSAPEPETKSGPDADDPELVPLMEELVRKLARYNEYLLHRMKVLQNFSHGEEDECLDEDLVEKKESQSSDGAIKETEGTGRVNILALTKTCQSGYRDVIRVLKDANNELKDKIPIERMIVQDLFLAQFKKRYERKLVQYKNSLDGKLLRNPTERHAHSERLTKNNTPVDDILEERLRDVERTLNRISEILTEDTQRGDLQTAESDSESDSGSTKIESELDKLANRLTRNNDILLNWTT
ncbi:uncharacterized protein J4E84_004362 [Alternaria hordeiaustralica]|uniref:uncharacterized protein n=1 Tax=Alternaria hordeiaustralica TaxID=1187925 RepID=UPI0020C425C3|nr:uncharacterized protein J4E84_004362 [Alternaria hordeiaustralica]KAI4690180.1 hypothetical protein J4E84_004362 [Alternaria hordeiaustralica]